MMSLKQSFSIKALAEIAIFSALGYLLDYLAGLYSAPLFPNGGSIGLALACVFIVALRRGAIDGVLTGLIMGLLNMAGGVYSIADVWWKVFFQIALDYWLAYPLAGFAGLLHKKIAEAPDQKKMNLYIVLGCLLGGFLKFMAHYLSGILFWPGDPWNVGGSYIYSALYNLAYTAPCTILSMAVVIILATKMPNLFVNPDSYSFKHQKAEAASQEQKADKSDGEKPASEEKKGE